MDNKHSNALPHYRSPAKHDVYDGLVAIANHRLAQEGSPKEGPERHQEVPAADAAQVEGDVRVGGHDQHAVEAVGAQEPNHPHLQLVYEAEARGGLQLLRHVVVSARACSVYSECICMLEWATVGDKIQAQNNEQ